MSDDITALYRAKLAKEEGTIRKDWGGKLPVALAFPNQYRLGMSNLGLQIVYQLLNNRTDVVAERFFLPEGQEMALYLVPEGSLVSLESQTPLRNFDLAAFSISFENDYPNVLQILEMGKFHSFERKRGERPVRHGWRRCVFSKSRSLWPFVDFFLLGEAEQNLNSFVDAFLEFGGNTDNRRDVLLHLARKYRAFTLPPSMMWHTTTTEL
jgi:radical SAM superfamily enzyme YgiQ (UPF0313 family)